MLGMEWYHIVWYALLQYDCYKLADIKSKFILYTSRVYVLELNSLKASGTFQMPHKLYHILILRNDIATVLNIFRVLLYAVAESIQVPG